MNIYGYARISRNEDNRNESIDNQKAIITTYAEENNFNLINILADDNVSGYKFERDGLNELKELIEDGKVDTLLVKDLSRIGRHNAKTLLFLEYLEEFNVRLILTSSNYDSDKNDDDIIGIETWYNEKYVKDISKKIRSVIRQKQKEGLVIIPPFGLMKDKDKKVIIDEESAETVVSIFNLYLQGYGIRNIAKILNEKKIKTPMMRKQEIYNGFGNQSYITSHLWYHTAVNRMLKNDAYIGILRCGKTGLEKIKGKKKYLPEDQHIVHQGFLPKIISIDDFYEVQEIMKRRVHNKVRAKNNKIHTYAGLLKCNDCGNSFVAKRRNTKSSERIEYVCTTYHKFGKNYCKSHSVYEDELNDFIFDMLEKELEVAELNIKQIDNQIESKRKNKNSYMRTIEKTKRSIMDKKEEIKQYSKQLAKGLIDEDIYKELTLEAKELLKSYQDRLEELQSDSEVDEQVRDQVVSSISIIREIIAHKNINNNQMSALVEKISVVELEDEIKMNAKLSIPLIYNEVSSSCDSVTLLLGNIIKLASLLQRA